MAGEDRKKFINEKIVGRNISPQNAAKRILLALVCGLAFGAAAAAAYVTVSPAITELLEKRAERAEEHADPETDDLGDEAPVEEPEDITDGADTDDEALLTDGELSSDAIREEIERAVELHLSDPDYTEKDLRAMSEAVKDMAEEAERYVTKVHAVSTSTTWFEDTVESSHTFSGLIYDEDDTEILVLTTAEAARSGQSFSITFSDGTEKDAVLKQVSEQDNISIIAVSKEGLGQEFLSQLEHIHVGSSFSISEGSMILAVGAPLGRAGSYDLGVIGMVSREEPYVDGGREVYYSSISSDPSHGTFFLNMSGELIGMADAAQSSEGLAGIVSIADLKRTADRLGRGETLPYIGLSGSSISFEMSYDGIPEGMYITDVKLGSPAYEAGIKNGDILTHIGNATVSDVKTYENAVWLLHSGDRVKLKLLRSSGSGGYTELEFELAVGIR